MVRSALAGALAVDGWRVGRDGHAALHLRRYLLDQSTPAAAKSIRANLPSIPTTTNSDGQSVVVGEVWRCASCGYTGAYQPVHMTAGAPCSKPLRAADLLDFDVFYRKKARKIDAGVALYISAAGSPQSVLASVPIWTPAQVVLPLLVRIYGPSADATGSDTPPLRSAYATVLKSAPGYADFAFRPEIA